VRTREQKWIAFVAVTFTSVFFINYCDLVFQCGCTFLWSGADAHCNIHHGPKRCPFCAVGWGGQLLIWLSMIAPQLYISLREASWGWKKRLVLALMAFPIIGLAPVLGVGLWKGYWN
jgi:hypothetical protein